MKSNQSLNNAKKAKNNEFYAVYEELDKEIPLYSNEYSGKTVFCNCNDGKYRGFVNYFKKHYDRFRLKLLVYSEYGDGDSNGKLYLYDGKREVFFNLKEKGDFRYGVCLNWLKVADIIVTGPPYSLFSEFINLLFEYNKKFLIIGDFNHVALVDVMPHIVDKRMWFGSTKPIEFIVPDSYYDSSTFIAKDGTRRTKLFKDVWYTNLKKNRKKESLTLSKKYNETDYPKCDNFDAIWVDKVKNIPNDYDGVMCVPLSFIYDWNPKEFDILCNADSSKIAEKYRIEKKNDYTRPYLNGDRKYARILIRNHNLIDRKSGRPKKTLYEKYNYVEKVHYLIFTASFIYNIQRLDDMLEWFYMKGNTETEYSICLRYARELGFSYEEIKKLPFPTEKNWDKFDDNGIVKTAYKSYIRKINKRLGKKS